MITTPANKWNERLQGLHREEGGAVLLLCLAGVLILMLMAWVLYDAGVAARDKIEVQAAADVAAYSQAAVKARSMNQLAYANIAKRSIWGIHSLYPSYLKSLHVWTKSTIDGNCAACRDNPMSRECEKCNLGLTERRRWIAGTCENDMTGAGNTPTGCNDQSPGTWGMFRSLSGRDYKGAMQWGEPGINLFTGTNFPESTVPKERFGAIKPLNPTDPEKSLFESYHAEDMRALDNYQRYMVGLTPWWGWSEQLVRAARAGATLAASWPAPVGRLPGAAYVLSDALHQFFGSVSQGMGGSQVFNNGMHRNNSLYTDNLPVYPGRVGSMRTTLREIVRSAPGEVFNCIKDAVVAGNLSACNWQNSFNPFLVEHLLNVLTFVVKSEGVAALQYLGVDPVGILNIPIASLSANDNSLWGGVMGSHFDSHGLAYTEKSFEQILEQDRIAAEPWLMRRFQKPAVWQMQTSNLVLAYSKRFKRNDPDGDRAKFNILKDYRDNTADALQLRAQLYGGSQMGAGLLVQESTYNASGYWAMSRSEMFFQDAQGAEPHMWSPSWSARLRPVSLGAEFNDGEYTMNQIFHDVLPSIALATSLGVTSLSDLRSAIDDLAAMEKSSNAMGPSTVRGILK